MLLVPVEEALPPELVPLFDNQGGPLDYNDCRRFSVNRWLKLVGVLLIGGIVVVVVSPDFDLQPTVVLVSQATQRPPVVAFAAITAATTNLWVQHFTYSPLAFLFRGSGNHPADLIDLNCTRLC